VIVLDTNVISEPLRPKGSPAVRAWLNAQSPETLYTTTINLAELYAGVAVLPAGKRRQDLHAALRASITRLFQGRVLPFDLAAAESYAQIAEASRAKGRIVPHDDGLVAAIARAHGFALATRNLSNFLGAGVHLIDPWAVTRE
jgi:predicted nucleic acid-binding protein